MSWSSLRTFATNMRGHLFASGKTAGISLAKGWNWISYPYLEPLEVSAETVTGIDNLYGNSRRMTVYTLDGILVSRDATPRDLRQLPKGVYIVNGRKMVQN